jgi:hypothetical protein
MNMDLLIKCFTVASAVSVIITIIVVYNNFDEEWY